MKVVRVSKTEFELDDGRVFKHIEPLESIPSLKEFQKIMDNYENMIKEIIDE